MFLACMIPENEVSDHMIIPNVGNHSPSETASHPVRLECSATPLREPVFVMRVNRTKKV
jgi:hypothetical protein